MATVIIWVSKHLKPVSIIAMLVIAGVACFQVQMGLTPNGKGFTGYGNLLGVLILVSVLMERAQDVLLTFFRSDQADKDIADVNRLTAAIVDDTEIAKKAEEKAATTATEAAVASAKVKAAAIVAAKAAATAATAAAAIVDGHKVDLKKATAARQEHREKTRMIAMGFGLVLGVVVSAVGFRALSSLVILEEICESQRIVIAFLDVFLTGLALAGGSDSFHKLLEVYRHIMEKQSGNR